MVIEHLTDNQKFTGSIPLRDSEVLKLYVYNSSFTLKGGHQTKFIRELQRLRRLKSYLHKIENANLVKSLYYLHKICFDVGTSR